MFYDTHTHSTFSFDSTMTMEAACDRAVSLGLSGIAFTDHLDINYMRDGSDCYYDFGEYLEKLEAVRAMYKGRLQVFSGVEIGLQPHVVGDNKQMLAGYEFDYKIGSTHLIERLNPYDDEYQQYEPEQRRQVERYLEEVLKNIRLYDEYCTVGHFDYLIRYTDFPDNTVHYSDYSEVIDAIFKETVARGLALEVNTRTYDKTPLDLKSLKRYKDLGGETVTIGSDAHDTGRIGKGFPAALELIKACGFKYIAHYEKMKPVYTKI